MNIAPSFSDVAVEFMVVGLLGQREKASLSSSRVRPSWRAERKRSRTVRKNRSTFGGGNINSNLVFSILG